MTLDLGPGSSQVKNAVVLLVWRKFLPFVHILRNSCIWWGIVKRGGMGSSVGQESGGGGLPKTKMTIFPDVILQWPSLILTVVLKFLVLINIWEEDIAAQFVVSKSEKEQVQGVSWKRNSMTKSETNSLLMDENILKLVPLSTFWNKSTKSFKTRYCYFYQSSYRSHLQYTHKENLSLKTIDWFSSW